MTMLRFHAEPIADVGIGIVGLGGRGKEALDRLPHVPGCHVPAVCDVNRELLSSRLAEAPDTGQPISAYTDYRALCEDPAVDLVYVCTDWSSHVEIAVYAMEHGKHVALEVPSARTLDECWALVNTAERTRRHCTILENCCYDRFELTALEMARRGLFGEIIHAEGSYHHNLEGRWGPDNWRLKLNRDCRGDLYPTHGFGPVCQALGIHRGDRLETLVSMDTAPFNGPRQLKEQTGEEAADFRCGDHTMTMIRTSRGRTILLQHDVMTPRPYDRGYQLVGTDGFARKYPVPQICLRCADGSGEKVYEGAELDALMAQYRAPFLTPSVEEMAGRIGGHDGMDFLMDYRIIYCLNNGLPLDMDVYDLAEWCCITELSRKSLEGGSCPVEVPDFTRKSK
ncbi:MAG: Gfo/Idh/MocA family oxidoreductase [Bacteroidales bacterium]|nr:Gfo/Idh/MocA family oxidoreductase [Bacteroidales bacterium]